MIGAIIGNKMYVLKNQEHNIILKRRLNSSGINYQPMTVEVMNLTLTAEEEEWLAARNPVPERVFYAVFTKPLAKTYLETYLNITDPQEQLQWWNTRTRHNLDNTKCLQRFKYTQAEYDALPQAFQNILYPYRARTDENGNPIEVSILAYIAANIEEWENPENGV